MTSNRLRLIGRVQPDSVPSFAIVTLDTNILGTAQSLPVLVTLDLIDTLSKSLANGDQVEIFGCYEEKLMKLAGQERTRLVLKAEEIRPIFI